MKKLLFILAMIMLNHIDAMLRKRIIKQIFSKKVGQYRFLHSKQFSSRLIPTIIPECKAEDVVKQCKLVGIKFNGTTKDQDSLLHLAAAKGQDAILRAYLETDARENINTQNKKDGDTPLHLAAKIPDTNCVRLLVDAGAQKNIKNLEDKVPYDYVKFNVNWWWEVMQDLLKPEK